MSLFSHSPKRYLSSDFDIEFVQVFAIERDIKAGCTVIGFWAQDEMAEWNLPCTEEKHEELYRRYITERNRIHEAYKKPLIPNAA